MNINRRDFLKYSISSAASLGLSGQIIAFLNEALAAAPGSLPTVLWLSGSSCTGCTVSLANRISATGPTDVADLLINYINLAYHPNLMGGAGTRAVQTLAEASRGGYVLAVEGGIPTAFQGRACILWTEPDGHEVTALEAVRALGARSIANLAIGTCASYGGMAAASPNPTGVRSLSQILNKATINIPGCPAHPDWIVWTIAQFLAGAAIALDSYGRPAALFQGTSMNVHRRCPYRDTEEASNFGQPGRCLKELGCKGPRTQGDCPIRKWNNGTNFCMGAGALCLGCTEPGFPDAFSPFLREGGD